MNKIVLFIVLTALVYPCIAQEVTGSQKFPPVLTAGKDYTIETTINKGSSKNFLMFSQPIPFGLKVTEIENKGGRLKFTDSILKITWIIPPSENPFTFSYQLSVPKSAPEEMIVSGSIFYIVDSVKKEYKLESKTIKIEGSQPPAKENVAKAEPSVPPVKENTPIPKTGTEPPLKSKASTTGKTYRIQIGAFKTKHTFKNVPEVTSMEFGEITKYYSGNYTTKEEASAHLHTIAAKGYKGAFIVAFENGKVAK